MPYVNGTWMGPGWPTAPEAEAERQRRENVAAHLAAVNTLRMGPWTAHYVAGHPPHVVTNPRPTPETGEHVPPPEPQTITIPAGQGFNLDAATLAAWNPTVEHIDQEEDDEIDTDPTPTPEIEFDDVLNDGFEEDMRAAIEHLNAIQPPEAQPEPEVKTTLEKKKDLIDVELHGFRQGVEHGRYGGRIYTDDELSRMYGGGEEENKLYAKAFKAGYETKGAEKAKAKPKKKPTLKPNINIW